MNHYLYKKDAVVQLTEREPWSLCISDNPNKRAEGFKKAKRMFKVGFGKFNHPALTSKLELSFEEYRKLCTEIVWERRKIEAIARGEGGLGIEVNL